MASSSSSDMTAICQRARPEILAMAGYVSARSLQLPGSETVFLDANECAFEPFVGTSGLSRYPAQQPAQLVDAFCRWLDVSSRNLTITRGADEAIDCLMRAFCIPAVAHFRGKTHAAYPLVGAHHKCRAERAFKPAPVDF